MFERKVLRKIFGPTKEHNGTWRIKTNKELDELIQHRSIINYVKSQRLSWFGHINRKPESSIVKKIYKWHPFTNRPVGRPKSGWEDDVKSDLKKLKVVNGQTWSRMDISGRKSLRKPRVSRSCSADKEEELEIFIYCM